MKYYNSMPELIGNTPMVRLGNSGIKEGINLFAKLELYNPAGSLKDRVGAALIENAERKGILKKGGTIVLATAGNTGIGAAFAALGKGYRMIFAVPTKVSAEKQILMRALGAEVINTPRELGMKGAEDKAREIASTVKGAVMLDQFRDQSNPEIHYKTTGKEIYDALDGNIDYVIAGAGSGGTYTGVLRYLKEKNPDIKGVLADPIGSVIGGGTHFDYNIEGIGNNFIAETMDIALVDKVIKVNDDESISQVQKLAGNEGIIAGTSSGAVMAAAVKLIEMIEGNANIVMIFPDRGDRYFSSGIYEYSARDMNSLDELEKYHSQKLSELFCQRNSDFRRYLASLAIEISAASSDAEEAEERLAKVYLSVVTDVFDKNEWLWLYQTPEEYSLCKGSIGSRDAREKLIKLYNEYALLFPPVNDNKTEEIILYILNNPEDDLRQKTIASKMYINSSYLSTVFSAHTGLRFIDYISNVKFKRAAFLLENTDIKVSEIASRLGYKDVGYFSRLFKNHFSLSPSQYRIPDSYTYEI